jgi:hypothetical protein
MQVLLSAGEEHDIKKITSGMAVLLTCMHTSAMAAMYVIDNPAENIKNPAATMNNPANQIKNPANNIYNPADRMDNPNPLSPVTPPLPKQSETQSTAAAEPAEPIGIKPPPQAPLTVPRKEYRFKTVSVYIAAAKKAFSSDNYSEFLAITDDALRRIAAGTLNASIKTKQKLLKYQKFGKNLL